MKKMQNDFNQFIIVFSMIVFLTACSPTIKNQEPTITSLPFLTSSIITPIPSPTKLTALVQTTTPSASPTTTPTAFPTRSVAGLSITAYEIIGNPTFQLDPLEVQTVQGLWYMGAPYSPAFPPGKPSTNFPELDYSSHSMQANLNGRKLTAQEDYNSGGTKGNVIVTEDGQEIYRIAIGVGSPIESLRGLWVYDNHWVLETAYVSENADYIVRGQISEDGILLNDKYHYEEAFGFQIINDRPFYFFSRDQKTNAWYDGQEILLGYDRIPHYSCCSSAELNPYQWQNRVDFFGLHGETWYLVQIGAPDAVTVKP
jgi:hypothetical protein